RGPGPGRLFAPGWPHGPESQGLLPVRCGVGCSGPVSVPGQIDLARSEQQPMYQQGAVPVIDLSPAGPVAPARSRVHRYRRNRVETAGNAGTPGPDRVPALWSGTRRGRRPIPGSVAAYWPAALAFAGGREPGNEGVPRFVQLASIAGTAAAGHLQRA